MDILSNIHKDQELLINNMSIYRDFIKQFSCFPRIYTVSSAVTILLAIPFYIFTLFVLSKSRKIEPFNSVFYRLVFILGIVDLLYIGHAYIFVKLPETGFILGTYAQLLDVDIDSDTYRRSGQDYHIDSCQKSRCHFLATYGVMVMLSFGMCQYIGITMTSFNRFTALAFYASPRQAKVRFYFRVLFLYCQSPSCRMAAKGWLCRIKGIKVGNIAMNICCFTKTLSVCTCRALCD